eukprot:358299-Chlamydomonas_euryale.AAC.1
MSSVKASLIALHPQAPHPLSHILQPQLVQQCHVLLQRRDGVGSDGATGSNSWQADAGEGAVAARIQALDGGGGAGEERLARLRCGGVE